MIREYFRLSATLCCTFATKPHSNLFGVRFFVVFSEAYLHADV